MKFHLGYYITAPNGKSTYHYTTNPDATRSLCGIVFNPSMGWERHGYTAVQQLERFNGMRGRKWKRRYCKTCLRMLEGKRDVITRLGELT